MTNTDYQSLIKEYITHSIHSVLLVVIVTLLVHKKVLYTYTCTLVNL